MSWSPGSLPFDVMRSGEALSRGQRAVLLACITAASPGSWTDEHLQAAQLASDTPESAGVVTASSAHLGWLAQMSAKHVRAKLGELEQLGLLYRCEQGRGRSPVFVLLDDAVRRLRQHYPGRKVTTPRTLRPQSNPGRNILTPGTLRPTPPDVTSHVTLRTPDATSQGGRTLRPTHPGPSVPGASPITRVRGHNDQDDQTPDSSSNLEGKEPRDELDTDAGLPISAGLLDSQPDINEPSGRSFAAALEASAARTGVALDGPLALEPRRPAVVDAVARPGAGLGAALRQLVPQASRQTTGAETSAGPLRLVDPVDVAKLRGPQLVSAGKAACDQLVHMGGERTALVGVLSVLVGDLEDLLRGPVDPDGLLALVLDHRPRLDDAVDQWHDGQLQGMDTRGRYACVDPLVERVWQVCVEIRAALGGDQ